MRLSQLLGKRIINIFDGDILGLVGDSDLLVDPETGAIQGFVIPWRGAAGGGFPEKMRLAGERRLLQIPWDKVCKVGSEVIVVDIDPSAISS